MGSHIERIGSACEGLQDAVGGERANRELVA